MASSKTIALSQGSYALLRTLYNRTLEPSQRTVSLSELTIETGLGPRQLSLALRTLLDYGYMRKARGQYLPKAKNFETWSNQLMPITAFAYQAKNFANREGHVDDPDHFISVMEDCGRQGLINIHVEITPKGRQRCDVRGLGAQTRPSSSASPNSLA